MSKFSWIHLSDLHFRYFADKNIDVELVINALNDFLTKSKCKYVFITGDVANKGIHKGVGDYLKLLSENHNSVISKKEFIFWAVGNHDIIRDGDRVRIINEIRNENKKCDKFQSIMDSTEKKEEFYASTLRGYRNSYKELYPEINEETFKKLCRIVELDELNLVILNTCLFSLDENDYGNMFVADKEFLAQWREYFTKKKKKEDLIDKKPTFVIAHYGKSFFYPKQARDIEGLFKDTVDLYLCGHWHELGYDFFYVPRDHFYSGASKTNNYPIYQITCGSASSGQTSEPCFYIGTYDDGYITTTPVRYNKDLYQWEERNDGKIENMLLPRFKSTIQLKSTTFILFLVGAQAVGKTTIARELAKESVGGNIFQICEVDFLLGAFRKELEILYNNIPGLSQQDIDSYLGSAEMNLSSYELDLINSRDQLISQNNYMFPRTWAICKQQMEKGIPLIVEGLNIDASKMIEEIEKINKLLENKGKSKYPYLFVNLYIDDEEIHYNRLSERQRKRKTPIVKRNEEIRGFSKSVREINAFYKNEFEILIQKYPDRFLSLENSNSDRIVENINTIIKMVNKVQGNV